MFVLCGCFTKTVPVYHQMPIIQLAERPKLINITSEEFSRMESATRDKVIYDISALTSYSKNLESEINEYNDIAKKRNDENLKKLEINSTVIIQPTPAKPINNK